MELQINNHDHYVESNSEYRKWYFKWLGFIMFGIVITILSFIVWKENAQATTYTLNYTEQSYYGTSTTPSVPWTNLVNSTTGNKETNSAYMYFRAHNDDYYLYYRYIFRPVLKFNLSSIPTGSIIYSAKLKTLANTTQAAYNHNSATSTDNFFEFNPTYGDSRDYASFGNVLLTNGREWVNTQIPGPSAGEFIFNSNGLMYLNDKFNNSSTTVWLGGKISYDNLNETPPANSNPSGRNYPAGTTLEIITNTEGDPITITTPSPYQSHEPILLGAINQTYRISGTCRFNGTKTVLISWKQSSLIPTQDDFNNAGNGGNYSVNCNNNYWFYDYPLINFWYPAGTSQTHNISVFSSEFLNQSRSFVNGYDSKFVSFPVEQVITFDPDLLLPINFGWATSTLTCATLPPLFEITGELPFFRINELDKRISCIFIDENFIPNVEKMKHNQQVIFANKIPTAYFYKITDLWNERTTTTNTKITLNLTDDPNIATNSPLKGINVEIFDAENLQYDNLPEGLKPVADFMEDRLVPVIFASFIIWLAIRVASSISA